MFSVTTCQPRTGKEFAFFCLIACVLPFSVWVWYVKSVELTDNWEHFEPSPRPYSHNSTFLSDYESSEFQFKRRTVAENETKNENNSQASTKKPVILMWSGYYTVKLEFIKRSVYTGKRWDPLCCDQADITFDRERLKEATAVVIFHYMGNLDLKDLPPSRTPEQLWVLFSKESPRHSNNLNAFDNLFNLTMSYRRDSDIFAPYGLTVELEKPLGYNDEIMINNMTLDDWINGKSKLFTGVISHCPTSSRRERVVKKIKGDIDIYGACGVRVCPRNSNKCDPNEVWKKLAREYKFYFAAENAICQDYITEKFWRPLDFGMVPVVYGAGNYSLVGPPGSYIDSRDFKSPEDLVKFLKKVASEHGEYRKYFEWRKRYTVRMGEAWQGWCDLCNYVKNYVDLLSFGKPAPTKVYKELGKWWGKKIIQNGNTTKTESICPKLFWKL